MFERCKSFGVSFVCKRLARQGVGRSRSISKLAHTVAEDGRYTLSPVLLSKRHTL